MNRELARIANAQHAVFTRSQALSAGVSDKVLVSLLRSGTVVRLHRGVYVSGVMRIGPDQRVMAAVLACGPAAVASHTAAAYVWDLLADLDVPHVTVPKITSREHRGIVVHRTERVERAMRDAIPLTPAMRTLLDAACVLDDERAERLFDNAHRRGLVQPARFARYLSLPANASRPRAGFLREVVLTRRGGRPLGSDAETIFFRALHGAGLPLPVPQHRVHAPTGTRYIDFAFPEAMLAIEIDGFETHGTRRAFEADRVRQNELELLGWRVLRFTWTQLRRSPAAVAATVAAALGSRAGLPSRGESNPA
jgi:very-short-patch-repair endonuclease